MNKLIAVLIFGIVQTGCFNGNVKPIKLSSVPDGKSIIYIYRSSSFIASGVEPDLHIDGKKKSPIYNGSYKKYILDPGNHIFQAVGGGYNYELTVKLEKEKRYYIDFSVGLSGLSVIARSLSTGTSSNFKLVSEKIALAELPDLLTSEEIVKRDAEDNEF